MSEVVVISPSELRSMIQECVRNAIAETKEQRPKPDKELLNIKEAAELLKLSPGTVYKMVSAKELPYSKPRNGRLYFKRSELMALVSSGQRPTRREVSEAVNEQLTK